MRHRSMSLLRSLLVGLPLLVATLPSAATASDAVAPSPEKIEPLLIGSEVPAVTLRTIDGKPYDLAAGVRSQPTVLVVYRGGW